jgi:hypothetical protein
MGLLKAGLTYLVSFRGQVHPQPEESLKFTNPLSLRDPSDATWG